MESTEQYKSRYPIHMALRYDNFDLIEKLTKNGYSVNVKDERGKTPLHLVIEEVLDSESRYNACLLLLHLGADVNERDASNRTPLYYLLDRKCGNRIDDDKLLDLFIDWGTDLNNPEDIHRSPLEKALALRNFKVAEKLVKAGANIRNIRYSGESLLTRAVKMRNVEMAKLLLDFNSDDDKIRSSVDVPTNRVVIFQCMIEYKAEIGRCDDVDCNGDSLLTCAVKLEDKCMLELLLTYAVNVNDTKAVTIAFETEKVEIINMLLENGMDVRVMNEQRLMEDSFLTFAVKLGNIEMVKLLLKYNVDVNDDDALTIAVETENVEILSLMFDNGFDLIKINQVRCKTDSLLAFAVRKGNVEMADLMLRHNANVKDADALRTAVENGEVKILYLMFEHGIEIKHINLRRIVQNYLIFQKVPVDRRAGLIECLLENGMSINFPTNISSYVDMRYPKHSCCLLQQVYEDYREARDNDRVFLTHGLRINRAEKIETILNAVIRHIALIMATNPSEIRETTLRVIRENEFLQDRIGEYVEKLELMKDSFVCEYSDVTYFDLLTNDRTSLWNRCSDEVLSVLLDGEHKKFFPEFADKLDRNLGIRW